MSEPAGIAPPAHCTSSRGTGMSPRPEGVSLTLKTPGGAGTFPPLVTIGAIRPT